MASSAGGAFDASFSSYWERFNSTKRCFESDSGLARPIHIVDLPKSVDPQSQGTQTIRKRDISNIEALENLLNDGAHREIQFRFISIYQKNSWSRLQITKPMLKRIVEFYSINAEFLEVPLCFFDRLADEDQAFCVPWTMTEDSRSYQMFYTFRYAEHKGHPNESWVIRQSGVYHQYDKGKNASLFILLDPVPDSVAQKRILECFANSHEKIKKNPLLLHSIVHTSYFVRWREYLAQYERNLLSIADTTTATLISKPLRISHDTLCKVRSLESRFTPLPAIIANFVDMLDGLEALSRILSLTGSLTEDDQQQLANRLDNCRRQSRTFTRTAQFLQQRSINTATLLADTLAFRNQGVAQEQNSSIIILTRSAVFITVITLIYLPWTLVTGLFGMEFFELDPKTRLLITSPQIWIYFVTAASVTIVTACLYYVMAGFPRLHRCTQMSEKNKDFVPLSLRRGCTDVENSA